MWFTSKNTDFMKLLSELTDILDHYENDTITSKMDIRLQRIQGDILDSRNYGDIEKGSLTYEEYKIVYGLWYNLDDKVRKTGYRQKGFPIDREVA
jgi:hypothetical protein